MRVDFKVLFVLISLVVLSACGSAPTVKKSKHYDVGSEKVDAFEFVYYKSKMSNTTPPRTGTSGLDDIRYESFGDELTKMAKTVFPEYGIKLLGARSSEVRISLQLLVGGDVASPAAEKRVLYVYASSGEVTSNQHMVRANYVFDVLLLDPVKRIVKWRASIDTSAWAGRDFVMKNAKSTVYDETYAVQLLKVVAEKMKADGVI